MILLLPYCCLFIVDRKVTIFFCNNKISGRLLFACVGYFVTQSLGGAAWAWGMLEVPLHTEAGTAHESGVGGEVVVKLHLAADAEVLDSEVLADVVPKLRLGCEDDVLLLVVDGIDGLAFFVLLARVRHLGVALAVEEGGVVLPPEVGEAVELQSLHAEEVVAGPYGGELHRHVLMGLSDGLVEGFEGEGVLVALVMDEVLDTEEPGVVDRIVLGDAAVVLHVQAPVLQRGVVPEVERAGNLGVRSALRHVLAAHHHLVVVEVVVDEEIGATPVVLLEHLQGEGYVLAVGTEVIQNLCVGLRLGECTYQ